MHEIAIAWAVVELAVVAFVLVKLGRVITDVRTRLRRGEGFPAALRASLAAALPRRLANLLASEILILIYAFAGWFRRPAASGGFTCHRERHYATILGVFVFLLLVETTFMHFVLLRWSRIAAWVLTGLSVYALLWIFGDFHALRLSAITVVGDQLRIEVGLRWQVVIPIPAIAVVAPYTGEPPDVNASVMGAPSVVVTLHEEAVAEGPFGIRRPFRRLGLSVDRAAEFVAQVSARAAAP